VFALLSLFYGNGGTRFFLRKAERIEPILKQPGYKGQSMSSRRDSFEFEKRSQFFIRTHNETLSVVAVCVCNPDCSPLEING